MELVVNSEAPCEQITDLPAEIIGKILTLTYDGYYNMSPFFGGVKTICKLFYTAFYNHSGKLFQSYTCYSNYDHQMLLRVLKYVYSLRYHCSKGLQHGDTFPKMQQLVRLAIIGSNALHRDKYLLQRMENISLTGLANLRSLELEDMYSIIDCSQIQKLQLNSVILSNTNINAEHIPATLQNLVLRGLARVDGEITTQYLTELRISFADNITNQNISRLTQLKRLKIKESKHITDILRFTNLTRLSLNDSNVSDIDIEHITNIQSLTIKECENISINSLQKLVNLRYLSIGFNVRVYSNDLTKLTSLTHLKIDEDYNLQARHLFAMNIDKLEYDGDLLLLCR